MQQRFYFEYASNGNLSRTEFTDDKLYQGQQAAAEYFVKMADPTDVNNWLPSDSVFINFTRPDGKMASVRMTYDSEFSGWKIVTNGWETDVDISTSSDLFISFTARRYSTVDVALLVKQLTSEAVVLTIYATAGYTPLNIAEDATDDIIADITKAQADIIGLQNTIDEAIAAGDSNLEVIEARKKADGTTYTTLKARLNAADATITTNAEHIATNTEDITALKATDLLKENITDNNTKLALKADISYVDTKVAAVADGSPKGTYATLSALQTAFPTGTVGIYVVTADGHWYYWNGSAWTDGGVYQAFADESITNSKIAYKTITPLKTTFCTTGTNLYNRDTRIADYYVSNTTGELISYATFFTSDYILIESEENYLISNLRYLAWYDINKNYISGFIPDIENRTNCVATSPANAVFLRFSYADNTDAFYNSIRVNKGNTLLPYEAYNEYVNFEKINIPNNAFGYKKTDFVEVGRNKFDKNAVTAGYYVNQTNGVLAANAAYSASDWIEVSGYEKACLAYTNLARLAFYDLDKKYISGSSLITNPIAIPENACYVRFSTSNTALDIQQFEFGTSVTSYQPYGYEFTKPLPDDIEITSSLPSVINGVVGKEINIYFDNIINGNYKDYDFDVTCAIGKQQNERWTATPSAAGTSSFTLKIYKNNTLLKTLTSSIVVKAAAVGNEVSKKTIIIGDSTTDGKVVLDELISLFNADVMTLTLLGTRGTAPVLHEGRSGWSANHYVNTAILNDIENAFYNPTSETFDFSYYLTNNSIDTPDYVIINLGINDTFSYEADDTLNAEIANILARYQTMIDSIHAVSTDIKIGIALTIPPSYSQDAFAVSYNNGQTRWRYKRNNILWVNKLIETYGNSEENNIYLVPINTNLDTEHNMATETVAVNSRNSATISRQSNGVHPASSGYYQIADAYYYWIKSFES